jgi:signal transduction histidine kinase
LIIFVTDNGKGFNVKSVMANYEKRGSLGMVNLMERAELIEAKISIKSQAYEGTSLTLIVPKKMDEVC